MNKKTGWIVLALVAVVAWGIRFYALDRAAVRSDEINFLNLAQGRQTVTDLWKNPPWMNQIPLADSLAVVWGKVRPGPVNERLVREPFALFGWLTVLGVAGWLLKRKSIAAGMLGGLWLALQPFHVYQSREAYYYVVVMAFAAGLTLYSVDLLTRLWRGQALKASAFAVWTMWAVLTCLTHMSTWVVAGLLWVMLLGAGLKKLAGPLKRGHILGLLGSAGVIMAFMIRWIWRAVLEMQKVSQADGHLGSAFGWVGPRVLPFFTVGANAIGVIATIGFLLVGVVALLLVWRRKNMPIDTVFVALTCVTLGGFAVAYAYIGIVGGGAAKISYFTTLLPVWIVWAAYAVDVVWDRSPKQLALAGRIMLPLVLLLVLWKPAWMVTQLDGKPVPYMALRAWLDENLDPGSVAVVDRWYEPWNEMARYAPSNVTVTFTVPDEPYENYQQLQWRAVTQRAIESGQAQAFIRLTRNHEARAGLWTWPETYFTRRAVVVNEAGLWSRLHGYAANEDFYAANTNRLVTEIFYDTREDVMARVKREGKSFHVFFGPGLPYEKSGPMGIFRFQTPQFVDWRVLEQRGQLEVYNFTDAPAAATVRIAALSPRGPKLVNAGEGHKFQFSGPQMQRWAVGPLVLQPGKNVLVLEDPLWDRVLNPLLIAQVEVLASGN